MSAAQLRVIQQRRDVEVLGDVVVPDKFYNRTSLGDPMLDVLFGGADDPGVMEGSTAIFTGAPGAGKSTFALQLAERFHQAGKRVLFNIGEENKYMVRLRVERLGLRAQFLVTQKETDDELIALVARERVDVLFQDSLQTLKCADARGSAGLVRMAEKLQRLSKGELVQGREPTVVVIGQCTKGGVFAGPNPIKHELDAHLHLELRGSERSLSFEKNRFGPSGLPLSVELVAGGLHFKESSAPGPGADAGASRRRGADKRAEVRAVAVEQLLAGNMLSGYSYERLPVDCSGGFWRGMLSEACEELRSRGYGIGERRVDGRAHHFVDRWPQGGK